MIRKSPDYKAVNNELFVKRDNMEFKIYENKKSEVVLEKKKGKGVFRKDNSHDGTFESALKIARK